MVIPNWNRWKRGGRDLIAGETGRDLLWGDNGDLLDGGAGDDALAGGNWNDNLLGGLGQDTTFAGSGNDKEIDFFFPDFPSESSHATHDGYGMTTQGVVLIP